jgi:hypothetical protein
MTDVAAMLQAYPAAREVVDDDLVLCIQESLAYAEACEACADACLAAPDTAHLTRCASAAQVAAELAVMNVRVLSRHTGFDAEVARATLKACEAACRNAFLRGRKHGLEYGHCRICAEACRRCGGACRRRLAGIT